MEMDAAILSEIEKNPDRPDTEVAEEIRAATNALNRALREAELRGLTAELYFNGRQIRILSVSRPL